MADKTTHLGMNLPLGTEFADQEMYNENFVTLDTEVAQRLTAVNGVKANENGEAVVTEVPFARQIVSDEQQQSSAEYTFRTTGGEASLEDGDATLVGIYGRSVHTGVANEVFTMTVTPASRTGGAEPITATINKSTFIAYVSNPASITVELLYTDMWSANPALYGITVTGTPVSGDAITVEYVRPDRGTITPSNPTQFVSTGWNLYNNAVGYARVKKYSDQYNFIIDGAYTSLKFSETYDGVRQSISALSNRFSVPSDGYVWVTGGDATTTCIYMTWSDWNRGYEGEWKAYEESVVDFSGYTDSVFPYGMCQVGPVADEIDFSLKRMIRRIDRTAYNAATIETLINTGVAYEADTDYIYYVLANPIVTDFDVTNIYTANDHGEEILDGDVAPLVLTLYGENLVEKLQHDIPNQIAANSSDIAKVQNGLAYIVGNTNTTGGTLAVGQFVYVKNHSTIAEGLRTITASISANGNITTSNTSVCSEGGLNALYSKITRLFKKTVTGTTSETGAITPNINIDNYFIISASFERNGSAVGFVFWRGKDGYVHCYNVDMTVMANASVTIDVVYCLRSELLTQ